MKFDENISNQGDLVSNLYQTGQTEFCIKPLLLILYSQTIYPPIIDNSNLQRNSLCVKKGRSIVIHSLSIVSIDSLIAHHCRPSMSSNLGTWDCLDLSRSTDPYIMNNMLR